MRSITRAASLGHHDRDFLLSASSNGIFIDLFSINGWLLQIFAVQILLTHKSLINSLVLAYPLDRALFTYKRALETAKPTATAASAILSVGYLILRSGR